LKRTSDGVPRLLQVLSRHADIVAEAFAGPVVGGDRARETALQELMQVGALKPFDEGTYYLSGALHDYFSISLASFHAFQTLTRIDGQLRQAESQWDELLLLKAAGAARDVGRLEAALQRSIIDVGDMVERNIQLLNTMVRGHYGNVDSLASKLRQNRFYAREVDNCLRELLKLEGFMERMSDRARAAGEIAIRQLLRRRLGNQLFSWTSRLKDAQSVISQRLFEARLMEERLRQLARYASWLSGNRTAAGWDLEVPSSANMALFRPAPIALRPQPDIADPNPESLGRLIATATRLKRAAVRRAAVVDDSETLVISEVMESITEEPPPHQAALARLLEHLQSTREPVSLLDWKRQAPEVCDAPDEHWLLYACVQLRAGRVPLRFICDGVPDALAINEPFSDIEVGPLTEPAVP
jgi:hypothetical protein